MTTVADIGTIQQKWGDALSAGGFQALPNALLSAQRQLGLSTTDVVVVLHLNSRWWSRDRAPFSRPVLIAEKMGVHRRTVERSLERMEKKGLLKRLRPKSTERGSIIRPFSLIPLAERLGAFARRYDSGPPPEDTQDDGHLLGPN